MECQAFGICINFMVTAVTLANTCRAPTVCQAWHSVLYKATQLAKGQVWT